MKISKNSPLISKEIKLPTQSDSISLVEKHIDDLCAAYNIPDKCYGNMLISVTEAVNNAIIHGNKMDETKSVIMNMISDDTTLNFEIIDQGEGFDYENLPDPTDPENIEKINGRGVFLMQNLSDKVEFFDEGKKVKLSFKNALIE